VKNPGHEITAKDVTEYLNAKVTKTKRLTGGVKFVKEIPKNPVSRYFKSSKSFYSHFVSLARFCARYYESKQRRRLQIRQRELRNFEGTSSIQSHSIDIALVHLRR
jgi:hypothetical protein